MRMVSTRGHAGPAELAEAVFRGQAPDGGLYMPMPLRPLSERSLREMREADDFPRVAIRVLGHLLGDSLGPERLQEIVETSLDFPLPLVRVAPNHHALELFHGPTLAFKDVGARFLARFMAGHPRADGGEDPAEPVTVLVATSGDTGGAVANAFHGLQGIRVVVLFPRGRVSPRQERQFSTLGGNVRALEVDGSFDDCQRIVKEALGDPGFRSRYRLTSANSINVGRLLPQVTYFFWAWSRLPEPGRPLVVSVPSGNFGNLAAGLVAKRLGLPVTRFVAATNANDVVPDYLEGRPFRPRTSVRTISTAMDVGDPSNFQRILYLYGGDRARLGADVLGSAHDDAETRACMARVHRDHDYVLDPHSAVGWLGLEEGLNSHPQALGVVLATAHPGKFAETVGSALGLELGVPEALVEDRERRVTPVPPTEEALARALEAGPEEHARE